MKSESNLFALVLRALVILENLTFSPFCFSLAELFELFELEVLFRDPEEVDAVVGGSEAIDDVDEDEVDDDEAISVAVEVRARLWRSRSTRSSLMIRTNVDQWRRILL